MAKVKLKYTGVHLPNEIIEVDENRAKLYIKNGDCELVENENNSSKQNSVKLPTKSESRHEVKSK